MDRTCRLAGTGLHHPYGPLLHFREESKVETVKEHPVSESGSGVENLATWMSSQTLA